MQPLQNVEPATTEEETTTVTYGNRASLWVTLPERANSCISVLKNIQKKTDFVCFFIFEIKPNISKKSEKAQFRPAFFGL